MASTHMVRSPSNTLYWVSMKVSALFLWFGKPEQDSTASSARDKNYNHPQYAWINIHKNPPSLLTLHSFGAVASSRYGDIFLALGIFKHPPGGSEEIDLPLRGRGILSTGKRPVRTKSQRTFQMTRKIISSVLTAPMPKQMARAGCK